MSFANQDSTPSNAFRLPKDQSERMDSQPFGEVKFYGLHVSESGRWTAMLNSWLSHDEQIKAGRFHKAADRDRFVLGRGFVRALCAGHFRIRPEAVVFTEGASGKPCVASGSFDFNVSHSGDAVLIAWSDGLPMGADVEATDSAGVAESLRDIAETSFSMEERAVLSAASEESRAQTFYRIWVHKEAIVKAEGTGLGAPLQDFSVVNLQSGRAVWAEEVRYPGSGRVWSLVNLESPAGHAAALAVPQGATVCEGGNILLC